MTTTRSVTSSDGTRVGFLTQGHGPGIVLVQGAMADVGAYRVLAETLSAARTVHCVERRGRGLSPRPYDPGHDIARDVDDVAAVLDATGASEVFGLSSGAVVALEAARTLDQVSATAVYEPPFYADGLDRDGVARLGAEIERGDLASALVDALLVAQTAPPVLRRLPRPLTRALAGVVLALGVRTSGSRSSLRDLVPGVRYDFHDVAAVDGRMGSFASVGTPVLLISGTRSPAFLRQASRALSNVLPDARLVELDGLRHDGPWNQGSPAAVAAVLLEFLAARA